MSEQPDPNQQVRQAVEAHIGMLTCQVIELSTQIQNAFKQINELQAEVASLRPRPAEPATPSSPMPN
jgi:peptidoglycan hydrolase CwlO-like protein